MSRSKKWRLEWAFFLGENGRRQYNHICKNVFTAASRVSGRVWSLVRITVPNGLKSVRIWVEKHRIIPCIRIFKGSLYDFSCVGLLAGT